MPERSPVLPAPAPTGTPGTGQRRRRRFPWLVVLLTSIAVAVYSPLQYVGGSLSSLGDTGLAGAYADRPVAVQVVFYVHIVTAGLALLIGGFQFSATIRRRWRGVHRWIGRAYAYSIFIGGAAALVMSAFSTVAFVGFFGFGTLAVLWVWTTWRGVQAARTRDIAAHQAWMIRSFALTYAAPTLRIWFGLLIAVQIPFGGDVGDIVDIAYAPVAFLCWIPNLVVAEFMIRRRGLPSFLTPVTVGRRDDQRVATAA